MKKILLLAALGVGYYAYTQKNTTNSTVPPADPQTPGINPNITFESDQVQAVSPQLVFKMYDNQVIADSEGYWMLVKGGKLYSPLNENTLQAWQRQNSNKPGVVEVTFPVWTYFANKNPELFGGTF